MSRLEAGASVLHRLAGAALVLALCRPLAAEVRVVTTTPTLADIARQVGGDQVAVESVMRGPENVHNVVAKPSSMMKLRRADLFVHSGLDAEPWAPLLVKGARRPRLLPGGEGNVDVSGGVMLKEVPGRGGLSRALGDIHVYGNTHYALDPLNGIIIARTIASALAREDPAHRDQYEANYERFAGGVRALTDDLVRDMEPYRGTPVVTYHQTWPYFLDRFALRKVAEVEPKPGIAPGPQHLTRCVETMKAQGARIVIVETFSPENNAQVVARRVEGRALVLAQEVDSLPGVDSYQKLFEHNVRMLLAAFDELGIEPRGERSITPGAGAGPGGDRPGPGDD
jgi:zinc/manganese transport system substrate-binding protein